MVNHGVSHACLTCKARRIKCDEQRPKCQKCAKSKRTCLGYRDDADILFKSYPVNYSGQDSQLPIKPLSVSETTIMVHTRPSPQECESEWEAHAMNMFSQDYVLVSKERNLSRGYFDGLEDLLSRAKPDSELITAARIVALASAASKMNIHSSLSSAMYLNALSTFKTTLDDPEKCNTDEALMTATLLGLYEMIVAIEMYPSAQSTHLKGISAILCTRKHPFEVLSLVGSNLYELFNPILPRRFSPIQRIPGLLAPYTIMDEDPPTKNLDVLLIKSRPVLERASILLLNSKSSKRDLRSLKQEASFLNREFALWPLCQPSQWMPQALGIITDLKTCDNESLNHLSFWPGNVDAYFDLYVAAVWNIYRKARLKLLDVISQCSELLDHSGRISDTNILPRKIHSEIQGLVDDICASIPFHLVGDLESHLQVRNSPGSYELPGKSLGGLLLMYPLYIASSLSQVSLKQRLWMRGRLKWIGNNMGIRQAAVLADTDLGVSYKLTGVGHSLLFAGALLRPNESS